MRIRSWRFGLLSVLVAVLIACAQFMSPRSDLYTGSPLLIAAASSLQQALQDIAPLYAQVNASQKVDYNLAASGALQQQIEQGAPVDVFISAADKPMDALQKKGLLRSHTRKSLLTNQLVLIVPKQSPLTTFQQLVNSHIKHIAIGEPRSVPAGQYATEVLQNLGILSQVQSKFVLGNNVKAVLTAVENGAVDAGIVYLTDAKGSDKVAIAAIADDRLHSPIHYPIAILKSSPSPDAAQQYVDFLQSSTAQAVFKKYGFGIAPM
jgi:molybdate transport system substrate-binding protein